MKHVRLNQSGLLFVPRRWQRASALRWLKRTHAWTGLWGAMLFLLLGTSGFFLNHRNLLKIDTGAPVEVGAIDIPVAAGAIASADALGPWAKARLDLPVDGKLSTEPAPAAASFGGQAIAAAPKWTHGFNLPDAKVTVDHVPGSAHVTARRETVGALAFLKNLHKGSGLGVAWVLFLDTIAGALLTMSLTGLLLWTRFHGSRLLAVGIAGASVALATAAAWPFLG